MDFCWRPLTVPETTVPDMFPVLTLQSAIGFLALWWVVPGVSSNSVITARGTLGRPAILSLDPPITELANEVIWTQGNTLIGKMKQSISGNGKPGYKNDSYIFPNGTLQIYKLTETGTGQYTAVVYSASGLNIYKRDFLLKVQDPENTVPSISWRSLMLLMLTVPGVAFAIVFIVLILLCFMRKKKTPEPVLEVLTYMEFRKLNRSQDDQVETEVKSSQNEGTEAEATEEYRVSGGSGEAVASQTEQAGPPNVSTFKL